MIGYSSVDDIPRILIKSIYKLSIIGSNDQIHRMFEMEVLQALTTKLEIKDMKIIKYILRTTFNIIKNGWK